MNKIVFLDRDGVINKKKENGYIQSWEEFFFEENVFSTLEQLHKNDYILIVVSNQAGVSKGLMSLSDLKEIDCKMKQEILEHQGWIDQSYYCIHTDEDQCDCRKPRSGLLTKALKKMNVIPQASDLIWMIGDSERDIVAGKHIGSRGILVSLEQEGRLSAADFVVKNISEATPIILREEKIFLDHFDFKH